jgi:uncharacterized membrane protein
LTEASLPVLLRNHWHHHARFYAALVLGAAAYAAARALGWPAPAAFGSDAFFLVFIGWSFWLLATLTNNDLERKADVEDEGAIIVTLITLGAIAYTSFAIFHALNGKQKGSGLETILILAGAPLSWLMLQSVMVFHYADIYYRHDDRKDYVAPIDFPRCKEPGPAEFVYFSMVVGMTAQVADTNVQATDMRKAVTAHGVVSFFFNTVLIAMAVNAAVSK